MPETEILAPQEVVTNSLKAELKKIGEADKDKKVHQDVYISSDEEHPSETPAGKFFSTALDNSSHVLILGSGEDEQIIVIRKPDEKADDDATERSIKEYQRHTRLKVSEAHTTTNPIRLGPATMRAGTATFRHDKLADFYREKGWLVADSRGKEDRHQEIQDSLQAAIAIGKMRLKKEYPSFPVRAYRQVSEQVNNLLHREPQAPPRRSL